MSSIILREDECAPRATSGEDSLIAHLISSSPVAILMAYDQTLPLDVNIFYWVIIPIFFVM